MKASFTHFLPFLLAVAQVSADCIPGTTETIAPNYTVQIKCDVFRAGTLHSGVDSTKECAQLAIAAGSDASTYSARWGKCIVGDGEEGHSPGSILMERIPEPEPEVTDPFLGTLPDPFSVPVLEPVCSQEERDACIARETVLKEEVGSLKGEVGDLKVQVSSLKGEVGGLKGQVSSLKGEVGTLNTEKAAISRIPDEMRLATCPLAHGVTGTFGGKKYRLYCDRYYEETGQRETKTQVKVMFDCIELCNARSWCTFAQHKVALTECRLYDRKVVPSGLAFWGGLWNSATRV